MRLSCLEAMLGEVPIAERFARARAADFDGIDLRGDGVAEVAGEVAELVRATGLEVPTVYARLPGPLLARTARERAEALDVLRARLGDAAAVGAARLVVVPLFGEPRIALADAAVEEAELTLLAILLAELAEEAEQRRVHVVLEPLNRRETHLLRAPTVAAGVASRVGSPWVVTMLDTYHLDLEGQDAEREIAGASDRLRLVHLSDRERALPGEGGIDFGRLLGALRESGYDGWYGFECGVPFDAGRLRRSVEWIRALA